VKHPTVADPEALLAELLAEGVEFIIVGGTAAVLQAAPIATQDLDIVHRRTEENAGGTQASWRKGALALRFQRLESASATAG
jgi:hypothetical protein